MHPAMRSGDVNAQVTLIQEWDIKSAKLTGWKKKPTD